LALAVSAFLRFWGGDNEGRSGIYRRKPILSQGHVYHPFLHQEVETVDVTGYAHDLVGHGYYSNSEEVIKDISATMAGTPRTWLVESPEKSRCGDCRQNSQACNRYMQALSVTV